MDNIFACIKRVFVLYYPQHIKNFLEDIPMAQMVIDYAGKLRYGTPLSLVKKMALYNDLSVDEYMKVMLKREHLAHRLPEFRGRTLSQRCKFFLKILDSFGALHILR
ncbi:MAG: hypothetical protein A3B16_02435 [Candidatus Zambryskibacteria bacterium RIFCSPLOWO2_01_FULL_45_43]|uniref:Uncharacterized protein n=2 Tax=Parcubacteria group TaxID=1794811 RepID=A0A1G1ZUB3_9BACT|nr:MAG: hypothetical protein A3H63_01715 [Candidatus Harrisonbacteria bacterium RIFCSPLOWO2_02_FULL_45_10c]OHB04934.1 MAG: hypothetical protein A3B16_02435 [Candidatus Zambryskibacteria bacterium RIFCSPLOWO2_01_FULL_45_43]